MPTRLYITRHGETQWNVEGKMQGCTDSELTERGKLQAQWLEEKLRDVDFHAIYSSPIGRAYNTAAILKGEREMDIIKHDGLKEIYMGDWEGLNQQELEELDKAQLYNFWNKPHIYSSVTGESFEQVRKRVLDFYKEVINNHKDKNILLVTHTIAIKSLMCGIYNRAIERLWDPPFVKQTSLTVIDVYDDKFEVILNSDISHYKLG